jgi:carbonyl reductase 1
MEKFTADVTAGREKAEGWPSAAYAVSKAGEIAFTEAIAMEAETNGRKNVLVNSCCPSYVNTNMTKGNGVKTVDQGAKTPVMLALGEIGGKNGEF